MRDRLLQAGSAELREEYALLGPRRDAIAALVRARRMRKLTQHDLAQRAGVSQGVISRLENGGHSPKLETLVQIARAMDYRVEVKLVDNRKSRAASKGAIGRRQRQESSAETFDVRRAS
ncbi:MAG: helix-turn-helix transcriptional regulator [Chloroflexota bacterium]|nr:helix-turn-helix transcriptional regulator [Chloroflexota bacterium]